MDNPVCDPESHDAKIDTARHFNQLVGKIISGIPQIQLSEMGLEIKVMILYDAIQGAGLDITEHEHPFYEFAFMSANKMCYWIDDTKIVTDDRMNKMVIIPSGILHRRKNPDQDSIIRAFEVAIIPVNPSGETFISQFNASLRQLGFVVKIQPEMIEFMNRIDQCHDSLDELERNMLQLQINVFILHMIKTVTMVKNLDPWQNEHYSGKSRASHENISNFIKMRVEGLMNRPFDMTELTWYFGLSSRQLSRIFINANNVSIGQYVISRRLAHAERLLAAPGNSVTDVANALGFSSVNYFISFFKKHKKLSPGEYQQKRNKN